MKKLLALALLACTTAAIGTHFCVVIPTFCNKDYCIQNIEMLHQQTYADWEGHIIIDGSPEEDDGTRTLITEYVKNNNLQDKITIHTPNIRRKALHNIYEMVHNVSDPETVVVLYDGDDYLSTPHVLERVAQEYADPATWLTYGQYLNIPAQTIGNCRPLPEDVASTNNFRKYPWITSHLRTFKAWLFNAIALEDLLYQGSFYDMAWDVAFLPMLEMAGRQHIRFIPDILYLYRHHDRNDYALNMQRLLTLERHIRARKPYEPCVQSLAPFYKNLEQSQIDIIIYSKDRPLQLYALLESLIHSTKNYSSIQVIYHARAEEYGRAYRKLARDFPQVTFIAQSQENPQQDFKNLTIAALNNGKSEYIVFAVDDIIVKDAINFTDAIKHLEHTKAYALFLRLGENTHICYPINQEQGVPPLIKFSDGLRAWTFEQGAWDWNYPNNVDMTIYRKKDIMPTIQSVPYKNPNSFEGSWACHARPYLKKIGLCYSLSKIINVPLNVVQHEYHNRNMHAYSVEKLLSIFNEGYKIDIAPLWQIKNPSAHTEINFTFVPRT